jgi:catechol 2,3-dioxygenase-like lactoylglutathione lyase family enzyme
LDKKKQQKEGQPMILDLHHVDILTDDMEKSLEFYQEVLGMQLVFHNDEGGTELAFLADRAKTKFYVELVGPPFIGFQDPLFKEHGPLMDHFSFLVEDADAWYEKLRSEGVDFITKPEEFLGFKEFFFYDASGTIAEIMMLQDPSFIIAPPDGATLSDGVDYRLHHISITCRDVPELETFYLEKLGMRTVYENRDEGYIFLADPELINNKSREAPTLELMRPPGLWEREQAYLAKRGPGLDHLCFTVDDVDEAYKDLVSKGVNFDIEPMDYEDNRIAFFKDPNGVDIELMLPMPRELLNTQ